ncbi:putative HAD hydrolase, family IB [Prevotella amnii CRIS 21A-A]|uniref:Putative HAD hydrolase, family IB n=1 Tax=Prevotella amnii CRIS 21A-A TaxID=679191 RepID=E1GTT2_9BACT|nr:HAD-IB family phosphatase [Prevotella amnii]EFN91906.1 putative HAD hydrolase, family IB [Prevotella amnii CRIS 21A-A]
MKLYAFDFDGTITTKDTFIAFIRFVKGDLRTFLGLLLYAPILIMMKLKLYPNWKAKQQLFTYFFKGMNIKEFKLKCNEFARHNKALIRPLALIEIQKALKEGEKVIIITASIDMWVRPFFSELDKNIHIVGTKIEEKEGKVTGHFVTRNCYGAEKVNRLKEIMPNRNSYELISYGDSRGDKELLEYADKGYFKPFRKK